MLPARFWARITPFFGKNVCNIDFLIHIFVENQVSNILHGTTNETDYRKWPYLAMIRWLPLKSHWRSPYVFYRSAHRFPDADPANCE